MDEQWLLGTFLVSCEIKFTPETKDGVDLETKRTKNYEILL
jgi:hypothetical protein